MNPEQNPREANQETQIHTTVDTDAPGSNARFTPKSAEPILNGWKGKPEDSLNLKDRLERRLERRVENMKKQQSQTMITAAAQMLANSDDKAGQELVKKTFFKDIQGGFWILCAAAATGWATQFVLVERIEILIAFVVAGLTSGLWGHRQDGIDGLTRSHLFWAMVFVFSQILTTTTENFMAAGALVGGTLALFLSPLAPEQGKKNNQRSESPD